MFLRRRTARNCIFNALRAISMVAPPKVAPPKWIQRREKEMGGAAIQERLQSVVCACLVFKLFFNYAFRRDPRWKQCAIWYSFPRAGKHPPQASRSSNCQRTLRCFGQSQFPCDIDFAAAAPRPGIQKPQIITNACSGRQT